MSLDKIVEEIKNRPGFTENVGMILVHNGFVRGCSRDCTRKVKHIEVKANEIKIGQICQELGSRKGIFAIVAQANEGMLFPGEDMLYLIVAGNIRENVIDTFTELLNKIKTEGIEKKETYI